MAKSKFSRLKNMNNFEGLVETAMGDEKALEAVFEDSPGVCLSKLQAFPIPVDMLHPFPNHPFKVLEDASMEQLVNSVKSCGLIHPIIVRKEDEPTDGYMIISGHRRYQACKRAGLLQIPAYMVDVSMEEATIMMTDANFFQRQNLLHSEKAKAYQMKAEAVKSRPGIKGADRIRDIGEGTGDDPKKVQRYLQLARLNDDLMKLIDENKLGFIPGVDLSLLSPKEQSQVSDVIRRNDVHVTKTMARDLKVASKEGILSKELIREILTPQKSVKKFALDQSRVEQYFQKGCSQKEMEDVIFMLLEKWQKGE